jgi:hypothetical protein
MNESDDLEELKEQLLCLQALNTRMGFALRSQAYALFAICEKFGCTIDEKPLDRFLFDKTRELTDEFLAEFADVDIGLESRIARKLAELDASE